MKQLQGQLLDEAEAVFAMLLGAVSEDSGGDSSTWVSSELLRGEPGSASVLEVLGGPEDGRRLSPSVGDQVGREGQWRLYEDARVWDRRLPRHWFTWQGPGQLELGEQRLELSCGHVLRSASGATVLLGRA